VRTLSKRQVTGWGGRRGLVLVAWQGGSEVWVCSRYISTHMAAFIASARLHCARDGHIVQVQRGEVVDSL